MVRICDFDPNARLHQHVRKLPQGFMHRCAVSGNALRWIRPNHGADPFAIRGQVDGIRLIRPTDQSRAVRVAGLKGKAWRSPEALRIRLVPCPDGDKVVIGGFEQLGYGTRTGNFTTFPLTFVTIVTATS